MPRPIANSREPLGKNRVDLVLMECRRNKRTATPVRSVIAYCEVEIVLIPPAVTFNYRCLLGTHPINHRY